MTIDPQLIETFSIMFASYILVLALIQLVIFYHKDKQGECRERRKALFEKLEEIVGEAHRRSIIDRQNHHHHQQ